MARRRKSLAKNTVDKSTAKSTAGKHPALRSQLTDQHTGSLKGAARASSKVQKPKKKAKAVAVSSHHMRTRSRAHEFRILDLPPEIRSHIYSFAYSEPALFSLADFKLLPEVSVSRQFRAEALPHFFASNTFTGTVRSNWCVFAKHLHTSEHIRYDRSGVVDLSQLLRDDSGIALPRDIVRFRDVVIKVICCCCSDGIRLGTVELRVPDRTPVVDTTLKDGLDQVSAPVLQNMFAGVDATVARIARRELFNGFTIDDILAVAKEFRIEEAIEGS